jgi:YesN/AraC family two-component response regulator
MNGFELIKELKKIKPSVQIIIISAHNDKDTLLNAIHIGICDFVPKPIVMSGLQQALEKALFSLELIHKKELKRAIDDDISHKNSAINELMRVQKSGNDIQLINHYRGVPIIHNGYIEKIEDEHIVIRTTYAQRVASKYEQNITITSELLNQDIEAKFVKYDHFRSVLVVQNLMFSQTTAKKRQQIRVEVDNRFHIILNKIDDKKDKILSKPIDISTKAIYLELLNFDGFIKEGDKLDLMITTIDDYVNTTAKVYKITKQECDENPKIPYRTFVVLFLDLSDANLEIIQQYIHKRQLSLLDEFRSLQNV